MKHAPVVLVSLTLLWCATTASAQPDSSGIANGKRLYSTNGCYQCHGTVGQGGVAGARLSQTKRPLGSFIAFARNPPPGNMPPYRAKVMSDQELGDVYAYIKTFPEPGPAKSLSLLRE